VDDVVYVGCRDAHVYAFDAATGRKKWDYPTSKSWVNATPAVRDGLVYAATSDSSRFFALDARTGRLKFNFDAKAYVFSSAALGGNLAYFGSHNGKLYAVDAKTGQLAWQFQTDASRTNAQKLLQADGSLDQEAFKPVFGDFQDMYLDFGRFMSIGAIFGSPALDRGTLYVGSTDGYLYALRDGKPSSASRRASGLQRRLRPRRLPARRVVPVQPVHHAMHDGRQHDAHRGDHDETAVQRVEATKQLATVRERVLENGAHATEQHRRVEERVEPRHVVDRVEARHADCQRDDEQCDDQARVQRESAGECLSGRTGARRRSYTGDDSPGSSSPIGQAFGGV
jgi:hypothetical protein